MNNPLNSLTALYKFQDQVLNVCRIPDSGFYLTGGTAAARGYLSHRFSTDLELKVNESSRFGLWVEQIVDRLRKEVQWKIHLNSYEERFLSILLGHNDLRIRVNFYNDGPLHMGSFNLHPVLGRLDSPENILANKLLSLISRPEPNDLADVWGLCTIKGTSIESAITHPSSKAAGLFVPDVARLLCTVTKEDWKMVHWVQPPPVDIYLAQLNTLGEGLLLAKPVLTERRSETTSIGSSASNLPQSEPLVRQIRGPGLLNYASAIKAAAQNSIPSSPPSASQQEPASTAPSRLLPAAPSETRTNKAPTESKLPSLDDSRASAEMRVRARRKIAYYLPVYQASSSLVLGHLADISENGFRIDCKNSIQVGQELKLRLDLPIEMGRKPALIFTAFCRWCQPDYIEPVLFNAGFEVSRISSDDIQTYRLVIDKYSTRLRSW